MKKKIFVILAGSLLLGATALAASDLGVLRQKVDIGKIISVGLGASSTGSWNIVSVSDPNIISASLVPSSVLITGKSQGTALVLVCTDTRGDHCLEVDMTVSAVPSFPSTGQSQSYNIGTATLKNGSNGPTVMELQRFLNDKLNLGLTVDGKMGLKTETAVKKWQSENDLTADGVVGPLTRAALK